MPPSVFNNLVLDNDNDSRQFIGVTDVHSTSPVNHDIRKENKQQEIQRSVPGGGRNDLSPIVGTKSKSHVQFDDKYSFK